MGLKKYAILMGLGTAVLISGCGEKTTEAWKPKADNGEIRIAVVGDDEFYTTNGMSEALEMAAEDYSAANGTKVKILYYDDDADYHKAIACAQELAADTQISAVIVKDELDYIDTIADIYEEAQKPFIITNGCYDHTIEKKYQYMLADFISSANAGKIMGEYAIEKGYKRAAFCHSDTEYEEDELKGFQEKIADTALSLCDTVVGPFTQEEFDIAYLRWQALGVDVICVSNYYSLNSDLVRMLREKGSDIPVISDYVMDTDENIQKNGEHMEGVAIVPLYTVGKNSEETEVEKRFQEAYGKEMQEAAVQSYDIVGMLCQALDSGISKPSELMDILKSENGYNGLKGTVSYNANGELITSGNDILIFSDGAFRSQK